MLLEQRENEQMEDVEKATFVSFFSSVFFPMEITKYKGHHDNHVGKSGDSSKMK
jgi:hypothetical protein